MRTRNHLRVVAITAVLALSGGAADAGLDEWTAEGPMGGSISALAIDPQTPTTIYAGTGTGSSGTGIGVFKSVDGGATWSAASGGLTDRTILNLVIDPQNPTTLYAGTALPDGLFKSTDGGDTWSAASGGLFLPLLAGKTSPPSPGVVALAIDPQTPTTLYAGADAGVYKTTDGGDSWSRAGDPLALDGFTVLKLAVDPQTPTNIYAVTFFGGVYKSTDGGDTWNAANNGLTSLSISVLAIDPQTPTTLYAGTTDSGVFKSIDGGSTWSTASTGLLDDNVVNLAIDPQTSTTLYADTFSGPIFESTDGGGTWNDTGSGPTGGYNGTLVIDPQTPTTLYLGHFANGVLKSIDGGATWNALSDGIVAARVDSLAIDPQTPTTLYAGIVGGGVFKSTDGGAAWNAINEGLDNLLIAALAVDPLTPDTLYAGTAGGGVFKSTDGGGQWNPANEGLLGLFVYSLAVDPRDPDILYAGTIVGSFGVRVFRSVDGGASWEAANAGLPESMLVVTLAVDPHTPTILYAGGRAGLFKSTDRGTTWSQSNNGLTELPDDATVTALAIDPQNPNTVYAGLPGGLGLGGVYRSDDGGDSWTSLNNDPLFDFSDVQTLAIDPLTPTTLYAGGFGDQEFGGGEGLYRSTDGGATWTTLVDGLLPRAVSGLVIDPTTPSTLYAGTRGGGVFENRLVTDQTALALQGGRFKVEVEWRDFVGATGPGKIAVVPTETEEGALLASRDSAAIGFFSPGNWEMMAKVLDGRALNGHFWVFLGSATNVGLTTTVTDTKCFETRTYANPVGVSAPAVTDTTAFEDCPAPGAMPPPCVPSQTVLCLGEDDRFRVETTWENFFGETGTASEVSIPRAGLAKSDDSGLFYFFSQDNWELLVKVLDGCAINENYWVFAAATTDVEYTLTVTDTLSDQVKTYTNPLGQAADAVTDTAAFATCP
ncbi:MAG: hypothetical protein GY719_20900 [bacterium]|nr:hypothetical protein [bacterium]